ncbi:MAG: CAAX prenyl protease-related protein, partial [Planctomycetes bacterium RBG_16_64_10]
MLDMRVAAAEPAGQSATPLPPGLLATYPWLTFVLPFAVFIVFCMLEPKPVDSATGAKGAASSWFDLGVTYRHYPLIYTLKLIATVASMLLVVPGYRTFPVRVTPLGVGVGIAGGVVWIALSRLNLEVRLIESIGLGAIFKLGQRSAFDPLAELSGPWAYGFLAVRLVGLVLIVPVIEEFFLRGFLMRYVMSVQWWRLPFGVANREALIVGTVVPMLYHPEMLAALVWFSAVSYVMVKTRSVWDCVVAHSVTNLILG